MEVNDYYVMHLLKVKLFSFKSYIQSLNKNKSADFVKSKTRIINDLRLMIKYLKDIEIYTYERTNEIVTELETLLAYVEAEKTLKGLLETLNDYEETLKDMSESFYYFSGISTFVLDKYRESNGNAIQKSTMSSICESIKADENIKIFDPQCSNGNNIHDFAEYLDVTNVETYGLDDENYGIYDAKKKVNRTIIGTLRGSKISNEVFDILFLKPRLQIELERNFNQSIKDANEKAMLRQTYRFLKPNGLLIYTIPFYRMYNDMWYFIAKNFTDITIIAHRNTEEKLITVFGIKNHNPHYSETLNDILSIKFEELQRYCENKYVVNSNSEAEVQLFRGSVMDIYELTDMIENDGLYNDFYKSSNEDKQKKDTSPLLPFNLGQIGLILTSGELDGIVEEVPGVNHIIKGMTVKTTSSEEVKDAQTNVVTCKNTISNMVQLNAFTADGDFISIN